MAIQCTSPLIDLVFMSNLSQLSSCSVVPPLENSDHHGLHLVITQLSVPTQKPRKPRLIWIYAQADYDSARAMIETTDWDSLISEDVNVSLAKWQARFMSNVSQGLLHLTSITYPGCQRKSHSPSEGRIISIRGPEGLVQINPGKNTGE